MPPANITKMPDVTRAAAQTAVYFFAAKVWLSLAYIHPNATDRCSTNNPLISQARWRVGVLREAARDWKDTQKNTV